MESVLVDTASVTAVNMHPMPTSIAKIISFQSQLKIVYKLEDGEIDQELVYMTDDTPRQAHK